MLFRIYILYYPEKGRKGNLLPVHLYSKLGNTLHSGHVNPAYSTADLKIYCTRTAGMKIRHTLQLAWEFAVLCRMYEMRTERLKFAVRWAWKFIIQ
jgi:hypothetical protein